ncbi:49 kDa protein [Buzura suppressaria nucleopolyhedrovirus]|uniref:49 kDa protein n=1 Tax=Buzura suppressaria nuclear polyhedrosis virus TaxID=74320 RepID=W5VKY7_NPVBS|nr:49 kDa protein [Buzura suppressaria nucleopolyhedrovirus]AHH82609.1 49 kDa protein [Buzura suppressaria nucleopolyhedrovirus]AKN90990.1 49K [Buzura suppressaria nucleopolyhedrovirus]QYF10599.1 49k [Buzura suppressaria nucleopolyhedrovirus]
MSVISEKVSFEFQQFKYLFLASYFDFNDFDNLSAESKPFILLYLRNRFDALRETDLLRYIDYLANIKLKNVVFDRTVDMFRYIKPQFKFMCHKTNLDILMFDNKIYVRPNTPIYATNFFVTDPGKFRVMFYREFSKVFAERNFVSNSDRHCLLDGEAGYVFEDAYLDWCGVRMCTALTKPMKVDKMYRLYLIGDLMSRHFVENNIVFANTDDYVLKNFYKGLPLFRTNYRIINSKKFVTKKPNIVFNELRSELDSHSAYVKFIQRDYIYDADFPDDLIELLSEYMTETAVYKFVTKFSETIQTSPEHYNSYNEIVVDRYAVNRYRKLNCKIDPNTRFPILRHNEPAHIMKHEKMIQIKGTLNAFYIPHCVAILANNSLFGATESIEFTPALIPYVQHSPPLRLKSESYVVDKTRKLYLCKQFFGANVPAFILIRGDYESTFKTLNELNNTWVYNTLLKLLITPELVDRSLEIIRNNF